MNNDQAGHLSEFNKLLREAGNDDSFNSDISISSGNNNSSSNMNDNSDNDNDNNILMDIEDDEINLMRMEVEELLSELEEVWCKDVHPLHIIKCAMENFGVKEEDHLLEAEFRDYIDCKKLELYRQILDIYYKGKKCRVIADYNEVEDKNINTLIKIKDRRIKNLITISQISYTVNVMANVLKTATGITNKDVVTISASQIEIVDPDNPGDANDITTDNLVRDFIFKRIREGGYRGKNGIMYNRYKDTCYWKPAINSDGSYMTMDDFIDNSFSYIKGVNKQLYDRTFHQIFYKRARFVLKRTNDYDFAQIVKNNKIYSFNNGAYILCDERGKPVFIPKNTKAYRRLVYCDVAMNHLNCDYDDSDYESPRDIKIESIEKILNYQKFTEEVKDWFYILLGRGLYSIDEKDSWQLCVLLMGQPNAGKSELLSIIEELIGPDNTGVFTSSNQSTFVAGDQSDKHAIIIDEAKDPFPIPSGLFQSMVSGKRIGASVKYDPNNKIFKWSSHIFMATNHNLPFSRETTSSISRRMAIFNFLKEYQGTDSDILSIARNEYGKMIRKCNEMYLKASEEFRKHNGNSVLPQYFIEQRKVYKNRQSILSTALEDLLNDDKIIYFDTQDVKTPFSEFKRLLATNKSVNSLLKNNQKLKEEITNSGLIVKDEDGKSYIYGLQINHNF